MGGFPFSSWGLHCGTTWLAPCFHVDSPHTLLTAALHSVTAFGTPRLHRLCTVSLQAGRHGYTGFAQCLHPVYTDLTLGLQRSCPTFTLSLHVLAARLHTLG